MKASELRVGNWVASCNNGVETTVGIVMAGVQTIFEPINITEDWLLRLGFKYVESYNNYKIKAGEYWNSVKFDEDENVWIYNNDYSDAGCYEITTIKYVHELQNLYHAINKEEL